jgi:hypothetical protein
VKCTDFTILSYFSPFKIMSRKTEEWDKGVRRAGAARHHEDEGEQNLFSSYCDRQRITLHLGTQNKDS